MRLGLIDLDTSHPPSWIPIEREMGHEIVGVLDTGAVHPPGYAAKFAAEQKIPRVYEGIGDMVADVDCAIVHGCDWDTHVAKARPFIEADKAVLIDKPMAGNLRDLRQFEAWAAAGARIAGGSALRFAAEVKVWQAQPVADRGEPDTVFCGCGVDEFNYGIHGYALLSGILGAGAVSVRHLSQGLQRRIMVTYRDGVAGVLALGAVGKWLPFHATIVAQRSATALAIDNQRLYRSLLESVLPYLAGKVAEPPMSMRALIEPELMALAARKSWQEGDRVVRLDELTESDGGYDGAAFAASYRQQKYPQSKGG